MNPLKPPTQSRNSLTRQGNRKKVLLRNRHGEPTAQMVESCLLPRLYGSGFPEVGDYIFRNVITDDVRRQLAEYAVSQLLPEVRSALRQQHLLRLER